MPDGGKGIPEGGGIIDMLEGGIAGIGGAAGAGVGAEGRPLGPPWASAPANMVPTGPGGPPRS